MIKIGTSGYSFKDWVGPFYPPGIEGGKMLDFYRLHFHAVEINSTYYRIPHPAVFYKIVEKTPGSFDFMVKVHKEVTHIAHHHTKSMDDLLLAVKALIETGKLKGFLAQFPYSFKANNTNLQHLKAVKDACRGFPLFVEFRHDSWLKEGVYEFLRDNNVGYVDVDEPPLPGLVPPQTLVSNGIGYIRFHGRNRDLWFNPEAGDRYDYEYSEAELKEWLPLVAKIATASSDTYLFFNNCHMGQAVKNAKMMRDMIKGQLKMEVI